MLLKRHLLFHDVQSKWSHVVTLYYWWGGFCSTCHHAEHPSHLPCGTRNKSGKHGKEREKEGRRCQRALNVAPNEPCRERSSLELGRLSQIRTRLTKNTLRIPDSVWGMLTIMRAYFPHQLQPRHSDQSLDTNLMIERVNINHPWFLRNHDRATPNRME